MSLRQSHLPQDWFRDKAALSDSDEEQDQSNEPPSTWGKELWTGVRVLNFHDETAIKIFDLQEDLRAEKVHQQIRTHITQDSNTLVFDPTTINAENVSFKCQDHQLSSEQLAALGGQVSQIRDKFAEQAMQSAKQWISQNELSSEDEQVLNAKLKRGYSRKKSQQQTQPHGCASTDAKLGKTSRILRKVDLTSTQIVDVIRVIKEAKLSHAQASSRFRIKKGLVSRLMSIDRRDPEYFRQKVEDDEAGSRKEKDIDRIVKDFNLSHKPIWTIRQIQKEVKARHQTKPTRKKVAKVLKSFNGMAFRKLKRIPFKGNTDRCLVLRSLFGQQKIRQLLQNKIILNVDETWLPTLQFKTMKQRKRGDTNGYSMKSLSPRLHLIAGIDTVGNVYWSMTTANIDSEVKMLFLSKLVGIVAKQRPDYAESTILMVDGAQYNKSNLIRKHYQKLKLSVALTAPYSYKSSPIEYWWGYLKRADLNQEGLKTSKKDVAGLVERRMRQMKTEATYNFWKESVLQMFRYTTFERL